MPRDRVRAPRVAPGGARAAARARAAAALARPRADRVAVLVAVRRPRPRRPDGRRHRRRRVRAHLPQRRRAAGVPDRGAQHLPGEAVRQGRLLSAAGHARAARHVRLVLARQADPARLPAPRRALAALLRADPARRLRPRPAGRAARAAPTACSSASSPASTRSAARAGWRRRDHGDHQRARLPQQRARAAAGAGRRRGRGALRQHARLGARRGQGARGEPDPARGPRRARPRLHPREPAAAVAALLAVLPRRRARSGQRARGGRRAAGRQPLGRQPDARHDRLHARLLDLLRGRARLPPARAQPRAVLPGALLPAQVRHRGGFAGERPHGAGGRRGRARLPGRRLRGPPPELAPPPGRLRRPQGLHPARARPGRADRARRRGRRAGDRAVPVPRRVAGAGARARPPVPPEGPAGLARPPVGAQRRRHARPHPAAGQDHGRGAARRSTCARSSGPSPTSTRSTTTSCG